MTLTQTLAHSSFALAVLASIIGVVMLLVSTPSRRAWRAVAWPAALFTLVHFGLEHGFSGLLVSVFAVGVFIPVGLFFAMRLAGFKRVPLGGVYLLMMDGPIRALRDVQAPSRQAYRSGPARQ